MALDLTSTATLINNIINDTTFMNRLFIAIGMKAQELRTSAAADGSATFPTPEYRAKINRAIASIAEIVEVNKKDQTIRRIVKVAAFTLAPDLDNVPTLSNISDSQLNNKSLMVIEAMQGVNSIDKTIPS